MFYIYQRFLGKDVRRMGDGRWCFLMRSIGGGVMHEGGGRDLSPVVAWRCGRCVSACVCVHAVRSGWVRSVWSAVVVGYRCGCVYHGYGTGVHASVCE